MYEFKLVSETIEIKDGERLVLTLILSQATYSEDMRLTALEMSAQLANRQEIENLKKGEALSIEQKQFQYFRRSVYPRLAACSRVVLTTPDASTRLPTAEEAWRWPSSELDKWTNAAANVNPSWFDEFKQLTEAALKAIEKLPGEHPAYKELKKKEPRRAVSSRKSAKS